MQGVMPTKLIKSGDTVFSEGDAPDGLYYICHGKVQISHKSNTNEKILAVMGEGEVFGEMALLNASPRTATVTVLEDAGFYVMNKNNFQKRVDELEPLMRGIFRVFVMQIRSLLEEREVNKIRASSMVVGASPSIKDIDTPIKTEEIDLEHPPGKGPKRDNKFDY